MNKRVFWLGLGILLLAYLGFWPVPIQPTRWTPPKAPSLTGNYEQNTLLAQSELLFAGNCYRCEDVARDQQGRIYGGTELGSIMRFDATSGVGAEWVNTGGRPLGLHFDSLGNLWVADAEQGLLSITPSGKLQTWATQYKGVPFRFTDDLEIAPDGKIYFTDASWKFPMRYYKYDLLEHQPNGRLLSFDPTTQELQLVLDKLYFANGVAVDSTGDFVLVNETGKYRVLKHWLQGPKAGTTEILIDNLPGFPDGISRGSNGIFWLALASPRTPSLDAIMPRPFLRKLLVRLPSFVQPKPGNYSFVLGLDANGTIRYNLQDPKGKIAQITSVQESDGVLYFGSLAEDGVGVFELGE